LFRKQGRQCSGIGGLFFAEQSNDIDCDAGCVEDGGTVRRKSKNQSLKGKTTDQNSKILNV
jgi:hypothetical protein